MVKDGVLFCVITFEPIYRSLNLKLWEVFL